MRLWSLHPDQLDRRALVAGWREALLAQKVLAGGTKGYTHHPQLWRFRQTDDPARAIAAYLHGLADGADARGYRFDRSRVALPAAELTGSPPAPIPVTRGQLAYEWAHLQAKARERDPDWFTAHLRDTEPRAHPLLTVVDGDVEHWEVLGPAR